MPVSQHRIRLTVRILLELTVVVAILLAAGFRFGPHIAWSASSSTRPTVQSIPATLLTVDPVAEKTVGCTIGPITLELPDSMRRSVEVERKPAQGSINLRLTDNNRTAIVNLTPLRDTTLFPVTGVPDKEKQTDLQLYREIAAAQSDDFSFGMTREELRWHKWLMVNRRIIPQIDSIEYIEKPGLEGNLLRFSSAAWTFEWGTADGRWKGAVTFHDPTEDPNWVRHAAATFALNGEPSIFLTATDAELKAMLISSPMNTNPDN